MILTSNRFFIDSDMLRAKFNYPRIAPQSTNLVMSTSSHQKSSAIPSNSPISSTSNSSNSSSIIPFTTLSNSGKDEDDSVDCATDSLESRSRCNRLDELKCTFGQITRRIDQFKIRSTDQETTVKIDYIHNVDWSKQHQERAGVIIYRKSDNRFVFGMGIDTLSGDITDFGGGVKRRDVNPIRGGLREFVEESLGVYGSFTERQIEHCVVIYSETMLIMFLHLDFNITTTTNLFMERHNHTKWSEIARLHWMTKTEWFNIITSDDPQDAPILYDRVKIFLNDAVSYHGDFTHMF